MATTIEELDRRVTALEKAQKETAETQQWMAATLGRVAAVQDAHTKAIGELQVDMREVKADLSKVKAELREVKADIKGLRSDLPSIVANALREVLKER